MKMNDGEIRRDNGTDGKDGTNGKTESLYDFRLFRLFRLFRYLSSFLLIAPSAEDGLKIRCRRLSRF
jgi:hypothetical protein